MQEFLKGSWYAGDFALADVRQDEVNLVATLHQSLADVGAVDPSFVPVTMLEYESYVHDSLAGEKDGFLFRLQLIRFQDEPYGYFHAYGDHPKKGCFFISMFLISPPFAKHGVGSQVAQGIVREAKRLGFERILLSVFLANRRALRFWIKQGFSRIEAFRTYEETDRPDRFILEWMEPRPVLS